MAGEGVTHLGQAPQPPQILGLPHQEKLALQIRSVLPPAINPNFAEQCCLDKATIGQIAAAWAQCRPDMCALEFSLSRDHVHQYIKLECDEQPAQLVAA